MRVVIPEVVTAGSLVEQFSHHASLLAEGVLRNKKGPVIGDKEV